MSIDLHVHTNASDATYSPAEVIEIAVARGLTAVSITDHDTMGGIAAAEEAARGRITFIPGLEISTHAGQLELHILGYFVALDNEPLGRELQHVRNERVVRIRKTVERLRSLGVSIVFEDVCRVWEDERGTACDAEAAMGRPHVAKALVELGVVQNPATAFDLYLRRGRPAYMDRYRLEPATAISLIRKAGGLPVLAHPGLVKHDGLIPQLVAQGLGGLEAYHTAHSPADTKRYLGMAERLNLLVTGGTDSHGPTGSYPVEIGALDIPDEYAEALLEWKSAR